MASVYGIPKPYIEPVEVSPNLPGASDDAAARVIVVDPHVGELSPVELLQRLQWYLVSLLLTAAAFLAARLAWNMWQRYRRENVPDKRCLPADRRSVVRMARTIAASKRMATDKVLL